MSDIKQDMALWEWRMVFLEDCPQSEVEELKEAIRLEWGHPEGKDYWTWRIQQEAEFSRELQKMGVDATSIIKAMARLETE